MFFVTIVAFLIVTIFSKTPFEVRGDNPFHFLGFWSTPAFTLLACLFMYIACRVDAARLLRKPIGEGYPVRVFAKYNFLSLFFLFIITAVIKWPTALDTFSVFRHSRLISLLGALAPFVAMLVSVWLAQYSFSLNKTACRWTRRGMLLQQLRWAMMPIIPPVIAFAFLDVSTFLLRFKNYLDENVLTFHFAPESSQTVLSVCRAILDGFEQTLVWSRNYPLIAIILLMLAIIASSPFIFRVYFNAKSLPAGPLRSMLENVIKTSGFAFRDILVLPTQGGNLTNAFVAGLFPRGRYLVATDALLRYLPPPAIVAVFGHEIGHAVHKHLWGLFLLVVGFSALSVVVGTQLQISDVVTSSIGMFALLLGYIFIVFSYISRQFERQADLHGAFAVSTPEEMQNALLTIAGILGLERKGHALLHYNIDQRVNFIERAAADPALIRRHHLKVRVIFWLLMLLAAGLGVWATLIMSEDAARQRYEENFNRGSYAYNIDNFPAAEKHFRLAIAIRDDDYRAHINLAIAILNQPPDAQKMTHAVTHARTALNLAAKEPGASLEYIKEVLDKAEKQCATYQPRSLSTSPSPR